MIVVLKPVKNRKCDFCGSDYGVWVFEFPWGDKWAYCKDCRKELHLEELVKELKTSVVFSGGGEDAE